MATVTDGAAGLAACTIIAKNYLPFARLLARSFRRFHPEAPFYVLLVDRVEGRFDPDAEPFELIEVESLPEVPELRSFLFRYTMLEVSTAVKPFLLQHLFARRGIEKLVYLDPDILLYRRLDELAEILDRHAIVLTPHLTEPIEDDLHPGELAILQSGAYNLGFLALRRGELVDRFLAWWGERLVEHCRVDLERGLFVDQKWIDLVPGLFPDVHVLTSPAYNVAYWNLHGRRVSAGPPPRVDGEELAFFHFSGFDPEDAGRVSKHQNRFTLGTVGEAGKLYLDYRQRLLEAGYLEARRWPYAFGRFDDGVPIPDLARAFYLSLGASRRRFDDPFATGEGSFRDWADGPAKGGGGGAYLSRLLYHLYRSRSDLIERFPDAAGRDLPRFAAWLVEAGAREYGLAPELLAPVAELLAPPAAPGAAAISRSRRAARRVWNSGLVRRAKFHARRLLGEERTGALKRRLPRRRRGVAEAVGADPLTALAIGRFGVNVYGYLRTESGIGEGVRGVIRALHEAAVPCSRANLDLGVVSRMADRSIDGVTTAQDYDVNLVFVNADQVPVIARHLGGERLRRKYNVGFWLWELEEFPPEWHGSFGYFHEIWTPSTFCLDSIAAVSPVPVRRVPLPVEFEPPAELTRADLGLPEDGFLFLFVFDFLSFTERKNPLGLVRAFKRAFAPGDGAALVLKTINSEFDREGAARLAREAEGHAVVFLDRYLTRSEVHGLLALTDCCVSLHRSEGFGLTLAEAMLLGKPVIATDYSANTDFMTAANSFPVRYRLVPIERDHGPYRAGWRWAEPDEEHAAEQMRTVFTDRELARRVGDRAREDVRRELSNAAVGRILRRRLERIVEQVNRAGGAAAIE